MAEKKLTKEEVLRQLKFATDSLVAQNRRGKVCWASLLSGTIVAHGMAVRAGDDALLSVVRYETMGASFERHNIDNPLNAGFRATLSSLEKRLATEVSPPSTAPFPDLNAGAAHTVETLTKQSARLARLARGFWELRQRVDSGILSASTGLVGELATQLLGEKVVESVKELMGKEDEAEQDEAEQGVAEQVEAEQVEAEPPSTPGDHSSGLLIRLRNDVRVTRTSLGGVALLPRANFLHQKIKALSALSGVTEGGGGGGGGDSGATGGERVLPANSLVCLTQVSEGVTGAVAMAKLVLRDMGVTAAEMGGVNPSLVFLTQALSAARVNAAAQVATTVNLPGLPAGHTPLSFLEAALKSAATCLLNAAPKQGGAMGEE
jgi:hypothetical protein